MSGNNVKLLEDDVEQALSEMNLPRTRSLIQKGRNAKNELEKYLVATLGDSNVRGFAKVFQKISGEPIKLYEETTQCGTHCEGVSELYFTYEGFMVTYVHKEKFNEFLPPRETNQSTELMSIPKVIKRFNELGPEQYREGLNQAIREGLTYLKEKKKVLAHVCPISS